MFPKVKPLLLTLIFATLLLTTKVCAYNEIKGAFGLDLGALFLPELMASGRGQMTSGTDIYFFSPDPPYPPLSKYYVKITPTSKLIYEIVGEHEFDYSSSCQDDMTTLAGLIEKKYGSIEKNSVFYTSYHLDHGSKSINLSCAMFDNRLRLTYTDDEIEQKAKREEVELKLNDKTSSGI